MEFFAFLGIAASVFAVTAVVAICTMLIRGVTAL